MPDGRGKTHMLEAFRWASSTPTQTAETLAAALGIAGPLLLAVMADHLAAGLAGAIGALAVSGVAIGPSLRDDVKSEAAVFAPAALAAILAVTAGGHGWRTAAAVVALSGVAAAAGGYSRAIAVATTRFILFLVIIGGVVSASPSLAAASPAGLVLLIVAGALWAISLNLLFGALARARRSAVSPTPDAPPARATARQRFQRWRRALAHLTGWQYTLRLALGLAVAQAMASLWPEHHLHWITLTVGILTQRKNESISVKLTQRALGTAIGVGAAGLFLIVASPGALPGWALVGVIFLLAGARSVLKARNYLAYTIAMTPLVALMMDAGRPLESGVLIDRLVATLIGAVIVVALGLLFSTILPAPPLASARGLDHD